MMEMTASNDSWLLNGLYPEHRLGSVLQENITCGSLLHYGQWTEMQEHRIFSIC